jgi:ubiquinone/menaquinone biosynthesis C-methylase UbiE
LLARELEIRHDGTTAKFNLNLAKSCKAEIRCTAVVAENLALIAIVRLRSLCLARLERSQACGKPRGFLSRRGLLPTVTSPYPATRGVTMDHLARVRHEFSRQADRFATSAAITDEQQTRLFVEALGIGEVGSVLDIACGPGIITVALAPRARDVVAFDLTPEMLKKARQRCASAGARNVTFREGSATDLPFADHTFDCAVTRLSIHHFEHPRRVLKEIWRVLKPGGTFVVADVVSSEVPEKSALQNAIEAIRDPSHTRMLPGSEFSSLISDSGFVIESEKTWDKPRGFEEWAAIVDDPARAAPLRVVTEALARLGEDAGMGLTMTDGKLAFFHRWFLVAAHKPLAGQAVGSRAAAPGARENAP